VTVLLEGGVRLAEETIVHVLANVLSAIAAPISLFLEDAHELADVRAISVLRQLVAATPPHVRFVISSRSLLDIGAGKLRATGQLEEIDWNDLRFTDEEIREYFRRANELELSGETVAKVLEKTEGWAAALQLTSLAVANRGTLPALLDRLDGEEQGIAAYLADDVLSHLPAELRGFLLKIGPLDRVCAPLCDAVTGMQDAQERLQDILARNIFLFSSDVARRWYRFHPLFSTFLRHQLERTSPGALTALYTTASAWFESERTYDEAVEFALRAGTTERAAQILNAHAFDIWRAGHQSRLDGWARQIPIDMRRRYPKLRLVQAWSLILAGRMGGAIRILEDVSSQLDAPFVAETQAEHALRGDVLFLRLMVAFFKEDAGLTRSRSRKSGWPALITAIPSCAAR
jgi:LuxR family maltose regulon positive regulatory protein